MNERGGKGKAAENVFRKRKEGIIATNRSLELR
jgi:hypothetical protein